MRRITEEEYKEYMLLKAGIKKPVTGEWISEKEAMMLTGWGKDKLYRERTKEINPLKWRTINGRKPQYSRKQLESLFTCVN